MSYKLKCSQLTLVNYLKLTPRNGQYSDEAKEKRTVFEVEVLNLKTF